MAYLVDCCFRRRNSSFIAGRVLPHSSLSLPFSITFTNTSLKAYKCYVIPCRTHCTNRANTATKCADSSCSNTEKNVTKWVTNTSLLYTCIRLNQIYNTALILLPIALWMNGWNDSFWRLQYPIYWEYVSRSMVNRECRWDWWVVDSLVSMNEEE